MEKIDIPKRYDVKSREKYWKEFWEKKQIYKYEKPKDKSKVFKIDTPPPTVSGKMHVGHSYSYSQMDFIARYKRMKGYSLFYPFGTDDNGLATERLVEKINNVKGTNMERHEFIELCRKTVDNLREEFVDDWKKIGVSADYNMFYSTINEDVIKISQKYFLDLVKKDRVYRKENPTLYCPNCKTAIAQVELEDLERESKMNYIEFKVKKENENDVDSFIIGTTRPELLSSCVAVFINPEHELANKLEGKKAIVPIFNFEVPIIKDEGALLDKGTGIVMCCTFGDQKDIEWYKQYNLPLKISIKEDGTLNENAGKYEGLKIKEAREKILEDLKEKNILKKQETVKQVVNVHERCSTEIEILHSKQWFIKVLDMKEELLEAGNKFKWHPEHMKNRYDNWVKSLKWDWCISRQRFFGVPFPVWYDEEGNVIFASEEELPVDPLKDKPKGYEDKNLIPEKDVMDTWATSSLTPIIATELFGNSDFDFYYPFDLRPQAHDIISFWLFNTVVRSLIHKNTIPWNNVTISGWVLDPKGRKMSKSKGNVINPQDVIEKYSSDALRYAASIVKLGDDAPFQEKDVQTGYKTANKIFNAVKFSINFLEGKEKYLENKEENFIDKWILTKLSKTIKNYNESFEKYNYSEARRKIDEFFWKYYTDNYIEFSKHRLYNDKDENMYSTLFKTTKSVIQLYAPFMPFVTEEVYHYYNFDSEESIHKTIIEDYNYNYEYEEKLGDLLMDIIVEVRKKKTQNQKSMKAKVESIKIRLKEEELKLIEEKKEEFELELKNIMNIQHIEYTIEEGERIKEIKIE